MLVLSRKPGERIMIGDEVVVTVVRIGPNNVRIGIDAPAEMNIVREELRGGQAVPAGDATSAERRSPSSPAHRANF
ncbi:MAG: carbon storage regulator [Planctomycetes bacterium]|nr:carbon storage regulator [Planctomycetota bacterium]